MGIWKDIFVKEILIPSIVKHEKEKKDQDSEYKEKRILYVSLYGIKETEEISDYYIWNYEKLWQIR